jgi:Predicted metal binding domain
MNEIASRALFERDVAGLSERLLTSRSWKLYSRDFPILDVGFQASNRAEFRLRLVAANWNELPPSAELLSADGKFLTKLPQYPSGIFNNSSHPFTARPFICMAGTREYHTHASHINDSWDNYKNRDAYKLGGIATQIWKGWLRASP